MKPFGNGLMIADAVGALVLSGHIQAKASDKAEGVVYCAGLNSQYLRELKTLITRCEPAWVSDHLCWDSSGRHYAHDMLPLP